MAAAHELSMSICFSHFRRSPFSQFHISLHPVSCSSSLPLLFARSVFPLLPAKLGSGGGRVEKRKFCAAADSPGSPRGSKHCSSRGGGGDGRREERMARRACSAYMSCFLPPSPSLALFLPKSSSSLSSSHVLLCPPLTLLFRFLPSIFSLNRFLPLAVGALYPFLLLSPLLLLSPILVPSFGLLSLHFLLLLSVLPSLIHPNSTSISPFSSLPSHLFDV